MSYKILSNRYCWVYLDGDNQGEFIHLSLWVSPDKNSVKPDVAPTPYGYTLTRNELRYNLYSEVQLSQNAAIKMAVMLYEAEFVIAPKLQMKQKVVNR